MLDANITSSAQNDAHRADPLPPLFKKHRKDV